MILSIETVPPLAFDVLEAGDARAALNGEVPSIVVTLDNARGEAAARLAVPPLRAPAALIDDGVTVFAGRVQSLSLAETATITLES